jgi:hypothetical protein
MRKKRPNAGLLSCSMSDAGIPVQVSWRLLSPEPETGACVLSFGSAEWLSCRGLRAFRAPKHKEYRTMRGMKALLMVVVAVCATSAMTAIAVASEFNSTGMGALSVTRNATQSFGTNFGNVTCSTILLTAEAVLSSKDQHATIQYDKCKAFGTITVTISPALYLFLASGEVHIVKPITISGLGCNMTVKAQSVNTIKFINTGKEIELKPEVAGIAYEGSGTACSGSATNGTYEGTSVIALAGQTISWK